MDWLNQAEHDPYFGALCLLAARGVEPTDHALTGALLEWVHQRRMENLFGGRK